ncbi:hypothetical protein A2630_01495 [Candidatus Woesebacteria bacterium RIFCSPHIGHO2_01_FULL_44_10]|uniref:BrnT family toxin n=1 Tax=Candidatus Woesebacteria bacterium RIFCSPLOWO2_01_FULL_44_14 TaxID=1802525 RepID=A0A1F8C094_9BACT|nr:MAG: hypothetical protein A2630_01495 [Candidatus Woesebacteria bacterium RIFCSPHIGHO2_01_FULL_44_10]OGM54777.1 MAG: hypothetical protein A3F62_01760 [Candidatus Woesebacteria bacterium RIFCSPHIGHO2_12_FULL_44_11]OGM69682.1 MAG: hypothetical protein A2975_01045 [Candidatus Woesebacteria bacterium RIFCSPLOWO2_01_FULL_44_14]
MQGLPFDISKVEGFEWDKGNLGKNEVKHGVIKDESEQVFLNRPLWIFDDEVHSKSEKRYGALGRTNKGRKLTAFFTVRKNRIRIISIRDQSKKDKKIYQKKEVKQNEKN